MTVKTKIVITLTSLFAYRSPSSYRLTHQTVGGSYSQGSKEHTNTTKLASERVVRLSLPK